jgi:hypothetical protein
VPITRKQFELGIDNEEIIEVMKKIYAFLTEHKDQAFIKEEIRELSGFFALKTHASFDEALEKLVEQRAAEAKRIKAKTYYSYGDKPLEL